MNSSNKNNNNKRNRATNKYKVMSKERLLLNLKIN